ncbi:hypothetical protein GCM10008956_24450 [Deinococcus arenae]|uniref:Uncharacterized protein n=1 Tax=Deinococcus arenae TaxID=1452751 RepID=A0A8H9GQS1_9DEIO|nr:hypothetical protein GCM10008956_24450 [Deinococcus arenae]
MATAMSPITYWRVCRRRYGSRERKLSKGGASWGGGRAGLGVRDQKACGEACAQARIRPQLSARMRHMAHTCR